MEWGEGYHALLRAHPDVPRERLRWVYLYVWPQMRAESRPEDAARLGGELLRCCCAAAPPTAAPPRALGPPPSEGAPPSYRASREDPEFVEELVRTVRQHQPEWAREPVFATEPGWARELRERYPQETAPPPPRRTSSPPPDVFLGRATSVVKRRADDTTYAWIDNFNYPPPDGSVIARTPAYRKADTGGKWRDFYAWVRSTRQPIPPENCVVLRDSARELYCVPTGGVISNGPFEAEIPPNLTMGRRTEQGLVGIPYRIVKFDAMLIAPTGVKDQPNVVIFSVKGLMGAPPMRLPGEKELPEVLAAIPADAHPVFLAPPRYSWQTFDTNYVNVASRGREYPVVILSPKDDLEEVSEVT